MKKGNRGKRVAIIHYHPVEWYPPAMNIVNYLNQYGEGLRLEVICREDVANSAQRPFSVDAADVRITRVSQTKGRLLPLRMLGYLTFYIGSLWRLLRFAPDTVLYYETISSWPALVYKRLKGDKVQLMAHYHEYVTPGEYENGMSLVRYMHLMEKKMYAQHFSWISQTNEVRLKKFLEDNGLNLTSDVHQIMPNYPPRTWLRTKEPPTGSAIVRLVYVGALGYNTMYFEELINWLKDKGDRFSLDVYAYNIDQRIRALLADNNLPNLSFHGGCDYHHLPEVLNKYDVGLIIYKPFSENAIHVMPNKAFEYLACGLDVWFPYEMSYAWNFIRDKVRPKMIPVDFRELEHFNYEKALDRKGLDFSPTDYYYEEVYSDILQRLR